MTGRIYCAFEPTTVIPPRVITEIPAVFCVRLRRPVRVHRITACAITHYAGFNCYSGNIHDLSMQAHNATIRNVKTHYVANLVPNYGCQYVRVPVTLLYGKKIEKFSVQKPV